LAVGNFLTDRIEGVVYRIVSVADKTVHVTNVLTNLQTTMIVERALELAKSV
jgi:hypothetical protein